MPADIEIEKSLSEWETRRRLIDKMLLECGWQEIVDYDPDKTYGTLAVREYPTDTGPADYALFLDEEIVAFVEAKKLEKGPIAALNQAERYAKGYTGGAHTYGEYNVPFVYSTNGVVYGFRDLRKPRNLRREISRFHTPKALKERLSMDLYLATEKLREPNPHTMLRPYQRDAIEAIEKKLRERKREMLVAMATGTGKTYTIVSLIYRLMWSGFAKRVLFLVDRRALAAQAVSSLNTFEAEPNKKFAEIYEVYSSRFRREDFDEDVKFDPKVLPEKYLTEPGPEHSFVYVCTIQRMRMNLFGTDYDLGAAIGDTDEDEEVGKLDIPIHAFDVIIADECHRGYTSKEDSKWREVLDHFDAIKIGLTATPAAHTSSYFRELPFRYSYDEAVSDGYLVDYDAVRIHSDISIKGMDLKEGEQVSLVDTSTGQKSYDILEDEMHFDTTQIERDATSPDRNRKIIQEFKKYALDQERDLGRFPKTLVFAINDLPHASHADNLVDIINEEFDRGQDFCKKITGNADRPLELIRRFRNRPEPSVVVTVDMLSTGVDVPKIENIILLRAVKSRILFEQMLGRGTRLCDDLSPPKDHFTVFDIYGIIEAFKNSVDIVADPPDKPSRSAAEVIDDIYNNRNQEYNIRILAKRLLRAAKSVSAEGRRKFAEFIGTEDIASFARELKDRIDQDWTGTTTILRNPDFIDLMENYPKEKVFVIGEEAADEVSSEYIFRTPDGRTLRPQDYIQQFEKFIKENPEQIEALEILLNRPKNFHTDELATLRQKLADRPERYTEERLRKAYNKELADIISMVKHAARDVEIEDPAERAHRAMATFKEGKRFNLDQELWLNLIEKTLVKRIILDVDDFKDPPFSIRGGFRIADKVFDGQLEEILAEINGTVLA